MSPHLSLGPAGFPGAIVRAGQVAPGRGTCPTAALHRGASLSGKEKGTRSSLPLLSAGLGLPPRKPEVWWSLTVPSPPKSRSQGGGREENGDHCYNITSGKPFPLWLSGV